MKWLTVFILVIASLKLGLSDMICDAVSCDKNMFSDIYRSASDSVTRTASSLPLGFDELLSRTKTYYVESGHWGSATVIVLVSCVLAGWISLHLYRQGIATAKKMASIWLITFVSQGGFLAGYPSLERLLAPSKQQHLFIDERPSSNRAAHQK